MITSLIYAGARLDRDENHVRKKNENFFFQINFLLIFHSHQHFMINYFIIFRLLLQIKFVRYQIIQITTCNTITK
jgi:hypothetical protein